MPSLVGEEVKMAVTREITLGARYSLRLTLQEGLGGCLLSIQAEREPDSFQGLVIRKEFASVSEAAKWLDGYAWQLANTVAQLVPTFLQAHPLSLEIQRFVTQMRSPVGASAAAARLPVH
jgi:hypothetical protein